MQRLHSMYYNYILYLTRSISEYCKAIIPVQYLFSIIVLTKSDVHDKDMFNLEMFWFVLIVSPLVTWSYLIVHLYQSKSGSPGSWKCTACVDNLSIVISSEETVWLKQSYAFGKSTVFLWWTNTMIKWRNY